METLHRHGYYCSDESLEKSAHEATLIRLQGEAGMCCRHLFWLGHSIAGIEHTCAQMVSLQFV